MSVVQLASSGDVEAVLGRDLTNSEAARVDAVIDKVSALFRLHSGQQFTPGLSESLLTVRNGLVTLPQQPVTAVLDVTTVDGDDVDYALRGSHLSVYAPSGQVFVTYQHGGDVPDLVRLTVADVVQKILTIPLEAQAGVQQVTKSTGPFSETHSYATWTLGGQATLSPEDKRIAESFRVQTGRTIHVRPAY